MLATLYNLFAWTTRIPYILFILYFLQLLSSLKKMFAFDYIMSWFNCLNRSHNRYIFSAYKYFVHFGNFCEKQKSKTSSLKWQIIMVQSIFYGILDWILKICLCIYKDKDYEWKECEWKKLFEKQNEKKSGKWINRQFHWIPWIYRYYLILLKW